MNTELPGLTAPAGSGGRGFDWDQGGLMGVGRGCRGRLETPVSLSHPPRRCPRPHRGCRHRGCQLLAPGRGADPGAGEAAAVQRRLLRRQPAAALHVLQGAAGGWAGRGQKVLTPAPRPLLTVGPCPHPGTGAGDAADAGLQRGAHADPHDRAVPAGPAPGPVAAAGRGHDRQMPAAVGRAG